MRSSFIPRALVSSGLCVLAASTGASDRPLTPPCSQLEGQAVTLHGTVTTTFDNVSPGTDLGDELALDPMEEVTLVTLRQPVCLAPENSSRPVIQPSVTVVELVSGDDVAW